MHDISRKISHAKHRISKNEISPVIIIPTLRVYIWRAHKKRHKSRGWQTKRLFPVLLKDNRQERSDALLFRSNISCYYLYFAIRVSTCLYVEQSREKEGERGISVGSRVILLRVESREVSEFSGKTDGGDEQLVWAFSASWTPRFRLLMRASWCNVFARIKFWMMKCNDRDEG